MRILFVIRCLEAGGGAERQLSVLARGLAARGHQVAIAGMYRGDRRERELELGADVEVIHLDKQSRWDTVSFLRRAIGRARGFRPDVVHGYMSGANELALLLARVLGVPSVWGIRVSDQDFADYTGFRKAVFNVGRVLSRAPSLIVANSQKGRDFHIGKGYPGDRFIVIPNGIDTDRFVRNAASGAQWREAHGIGPTEPLIVLPARLDPMKDHRTFVDAIALMAAHDTTTRFVAMGRGATADRDSLVAYAESQGVTSRLMVLPDEPAVEAVYNAADLVTLTSAFGEGFPNVLGEAMACERLCVSTDVGDAAIVIGTEGVIVPIRNPEQLAAAWRQQLQLDPAARAAIGQRARHHITSRFSIPVLLEVTETHLRTLTGRS